MKQVNWFDRKFDFQDNQNIFPSIIERLTGTPIRLEEKLNGVAESVLIASADNSWTIKQNIGHLIDLEPLWQGRLEDILNNRLEFRPADLQNTKTHFANHNDLPLKELLSGFRKIRLQTITQIREIDDEIIFKSALHPRLKTPMRTMDHFLFVVEHDDHHLSRISQLLAIR